MVRLGPRVPAKAEPILGPRGSQKGFREQGGPRLFGIEETPFREQGELSWGVGKARLGNGERRACFGIEESSFQEWGKLCWDAGKACPGNEESPSPPGAVGVWDLFQWLPWACPGVSASAALFLNPLPSSQLTINTAIVYMHRFYMVQSFTQFHRNVSAGIWGVGGAGHPKSTPAAAWVGGPPWEGVWAGRGTLFSLLVVAGLEQPSFPEGILRIHLIYLL